jgi:hypothetical protein
MLSFGLLLGLQQGELDQLSRESADADAPRSRERLDAIFDLRFDVAPYQVLFDYLFLFPISHIYIVYHHTRFWFVYLP